MTVTFVAVLSEVGELWHRVRRTRRLSDDRVFAALAQKVITILRMILGISRRVTSNFGSQLRPRWTSPGAALPKVTSRISDAI